MRRTKARCSWAAASPRPRMYRKRPCRRSTPKSARSSTSNTRWRASSSKTTATKCMPWRRPCSNGKPSTPSRSTTSWKVASRARRKPRRRPPTPATSRLRRQASLPARAATLLLPRSDRPGAPAQTGAPLSSPLRMSTTLNCGRFELDLRRPLVMGIPNVTPDSFSDGTGELSLQRVLERAHQMVEDGADMLDIGGESTRPGADPVPLQEELDRVLPLVEALHGLNIPLSVDTFKPAVMAAALKSGADMINDIRALREPGAVEAVKDSDCGLCIMHMQGEPRTMQVNPHYDDVVAEVRQFLEARAQSMVEAGISPQRIVLDPGFGFGKTVGQNYTMLRRLDQMRVGDYTWLLGFSRKSMLGHVVGREPGERLAASLAAALYGMEMGGHILRVHDVAETVDAVKIWRTIKDESFV